MICGLGSLAVRVSGAAMGSGAARAWEKRAANAMRDTIENFILVQIEEW